MKRLILISCFVIIGSSVCVAQKRFRRTPVPLAKNIKFEPNRSYSGYYAKGAEKYERVTGPRAKNRKPGKSVYYHKKRVTGPKAKNKD